MFTSDERNNLPGDSLAYYCAERAKGGAALVEVSMAIVGDEVGQTFQIRLLTLAPSREDIR